jgi:hypothetical protein
VLLPVTRSEEVLGRPGGTVDDALEAAGTADIELGDPGTVLGSDTPLDELPAYEGPPEPVGGPPPEWGAAAAEVPESELG